MRYNQVETIWCGLWKIPWNCLKQRKKSVSTRKASNSKRFQMSCCKINMTPSKPITVFCTDFKPDSCHRAWMRVGLGRFIAGIFYMVKKKLFYSSFQKNRLFPGCQVVENHEYDFEKKLSTASWLCVVCNKEFYTTYSLLILGIWFIN